MKQFRETNYYVTTDGRVFNNRNKEMKLDEHRGNSSKYLRAQLWVNGRKKNMRVHRMVAECYVDNAENKPHVHHKDGDTFNNNAENLEWVTPAENNAYRGG